MQVIEVSSPDASVPETVFATPTFMLDDRLMQLGNPGPDDIIFAEAVEDCLLMRDEPPRGSEGCPLASPASLARPVRCG